MSPIDWAAWHDAYDDPDNPLHDLAATIRLLPQLCVGGGTVIWTRHRKPPDRTPRVRRLLARGGFEELAFDAPAGEVFTVGSHRHTGAPEPLQPEARLFSSFRS